MPLLEDQEEFSYHFRVDGDPEDMVSSIGVTGTSDVHPFADQPNIAFAGFENIILPLLSSSVNLVKVVLRRGQDGGVIEYASTNPSNNGERSANMLIQNTAYLLHKRTEAVGPGRNGRMYLPGVPDDKVNNIGVVGQAELDALNAAAADWLADFTDNDLGQPVVNHGSGVALSGTSDIVSLEFDAVCATQRRRLRH